MVEVREEGMERMTRLKLGGMKGGELWKMRGYEVQKRRNKANNEEKR